MHRKNLTERERVVRKRDIWRNKTAWWCGLEREEKLCEGWGGFGLFISKVFLKFGEIGIECFLNVFLI
jgi:hypothetical protein